MLKKYSKSGTVLSAKQMMNVHGGANDENFFLPSCRFVPCPSSCATVPPGSQSWYCDTSSHNCIPVNCPIDPL